MRYPLEGEHADDEETQPAPQLVSPLPTPEEVLAAWSRQESLGSAMRRLPTRCRDLLTLIFLDRDEPSYDTIGERLGIPKGSIGPTRNRCLQQLRAILEGLGVNSAE